MEIFIYLVCAWRKTKSPIPKRWPHTSKTNCETCILGINMLWPRMACLTPWMDYITNSKVMLLLETHTLEWAFDGWCEIETLRMLMRATIEEGAFWPFGPVRVNINGGTHDAPNLTWILNPKVMNHNIREPNTNSGKVVWKTWIVCFTFLGLSFESQCYHFQSLGLWIVHL